MTEELKQGGDVLEALATELDEIADGLYSTNALRARQVRNCAMRIKRAALQSRTPPVSADKIFGGRMTAEGALKALVGYHIAGGEMTTRDEILQRWIIDANEGRIKDGTRELTNDELALIGNVLRAIAGDFMLAGAQSTAQAGETKSK